MKKLLQLLAHLVAIVVIYMFVSMGASLVLPSLNLDGGDADFGFMLTNLLISLAIFVVLTIYERVACGRVERSGRSIKGFDPLTILVGVILLLAVAIVTLPLEQWLDQDVRRFPDGGWTLFAAVVVAPVLEELIFRGRVYSIFRRIVPPSLAIVLGALIFAAAHGSFIVAIDAFLAGVIFGYFYIVKRSIFTPIILHMCNNAVAFALMELSYRGQGLMDIFSSSAIFFIIYGVALVIAMIGFGHMVRTFFRADMECDIELNQE